MEQKEYERINEKIDEWAKSLPDEFYLKTKRYEKDGKHYIKFSVIDPFGYNNQNYINFLLDYIEHSGRVGKIKEIVTEDLNPEIKFEYED